jgi:hypothetical protein
MIDRNREEGMQPRSTSKRVLVATLWLAAGWPVLAEAEEQPPNDALAHAIAMRGGGWTTTGTNRGATLEPGEPDHDKATPGASVWWRWTAPWSGLVTLTTKGSDFDTVLGVYTGDSLAGLRVVASNDDDHGRQSTARFVAVAGTSYAIAVAGVNAWTGRIVLSLAFAPVGARPAP